MRPPKMDSFMLTKKQKRYNFSFSISCFGTTAASSEALLQVKHDGNSLLCINIKHCFKVLRYYFMMNIQ